MDHANDPTHEQMMNIRRLHKRLAIKLKNVINPENLKDLKFYFSDSAFAEGELQAGDDFYDIWKKLEKEGMIKPRIYEPLEKALCDIGLSCLCDIFDDFKGLMTHEAVAFNDWIQDNRVIDSKKMMAEALGDYARLMERGRPGVVFLNAVIGRITQQGGSIRLRNGSVTLHVPENAILPSHDLTVAEAEPRIFWIIRIHAEATEIREERFHASPGNEQVLPSPGDITTFSLSVNLGPEDVNFRNKVKLTVKQFCQLNIGRNHGPKWSLYRKKEANNCWESHGGCNIDWDTRIATFELSCFSSYVVGAPTSALSESSYGLSVRVLLSKDSVNNISVFIALNDSSYIEEFITSHRDQGNRRLSVARETCLYLDLKYNLIVTWVMKTQNGPSSQKQVVLPVKHLHNLSEKLARIRLAGPDTQDTGLHEDVLILSQNGNEVLKLPFKREATTYPTETKAPEVIDTSTVDEELKVVLPVKPIPDSQETGTHEDVLTLSQNGNQALKRPSKRGAAMYPTETIKALAIDTVDEELKGQQEQSKIKEAEPDTHKKILGDTSTPQEGLKKCDEKFNKLFTTMITQHRAKTDAYLLALEGHYDLLEHGTPEKSPIPFRPQADGAPLPSLDRLPAEGREKVVMQGGERKGRAEGNPFSISFSSNRDVDKNYEGDISESGYDTASISASLTSASSLTEIDENYSLEVEKLDLDYKYTCRIARENGLECEQPRAFPLQGSHSWMIGCVQCLQPTEQHRYYQEVKAQHNCGENVLAIKRNGEKYWQCVRVRIGKGHDFPGYYQFCNEYIKGQMCSTDQMFCSFAHHPYEKLLWTLEKGGKFNITDFIRINRSDVNESKYCLQLLKSHGGEIVFICKRCFYQNPSKNSKQHGEMCEDDHPWLENNKIMAHVIEWNDRITRQIRDRPFYHENAFFKMCFYLQLCERENCRKAHSLVEKAVWDVETDMGLTRIAIVEEYTKESHLKDVSPEVQKCPYKVTFVCGLCWNNGQSTSKSPIGDVCAAKAQHKWDLNKVAVCWPKKDIIRMLQLDKNIKTFTKCNKNPCKKYPHCSHPHSDTERDIWSWMIKAKVNSLEDLVKISAMYFN